MKVHYTQHRRHDREHKILWLQRFLDRWRFSDSIRRGMRVHMTLHQVAENILTIHSWYINFAEKQDSWLSILKYLDTSPRIVVSRYRIMMDSSKSIHLSWNHNIDLSGKILVHTFYCRNYIDRIWDTQSHTHHYTCMPGSNKLCNPFLGRCWRILSTENRRLCKRLGPLVYKSLTSNHLYIFRLIVMNTHLYKMYTQKRINNICTPSGKLSTLLPINTCLSRHHIMCIVVNYLKVGMDNCKKSKWPECHSWSKIGN